MSEKVLRVIAQEPSVTIDHLSEQLGVTQRRVERTLRKLQNEGLLERVGGRKQGHWKLLK